MAPCTVHTYERDNVVVLNLEGSLVFEDNKKVKAFIWQSFDRPIHGLVLDMSKIERVNSKGVSVLLFAKTLCDEHKTKLILTHLPDKAKQLLHINRLEDILDIRDEDVGTIITQLTTKG